MKTEELYVVVNTDMDILLNEVWEDDYEATIKCKQYNNYNPVWSKMTLFEYIHALNQTKEG